MKKLNILKYLWCAIPAILISCVENELSGVGDLEDITAPTPFFSAANLSRGTFFCDESLESAHYEYSFTPGSKLAVNGVDYNWTVSPPENIQVIRKDIRVLEATIEGTRAGVISLEEKIATLTKSLDCVDPADTVKIDEINEEIDFLTNTALPNAIDFLAQPPVDEDGELIPDGIIPNDLIADLETQIAELSLSPFTLDDREFNLVFPGPGDYDVTLTVTDALGNSTDLLRPLRIIEPVFQIPTPEIGEPSFEDNSRFDGTGDGLGSWKNPFDTGSDRVIWSPTGDNTFLGTQISSTASDGKQAAKYPGATTVDGFSSRIAYQEIDVTPGTKYIISFSSAFDAKEDSESSLIFKIIDPETASFTDALEPSNTIAESVISNEGRTNKSYARHTLSFEVEDLESVVILIYAQGNDSNTYLDDIQIIVNN